MGVPVKRRRALLRNNNLPRDEIETEFAGLGSEFHSLPILNALLQLLEDGSVVFLMSRDHVIDNARQFVSGRGHCLWCAEPSFHPAKVIPKEGLTPMQPLGCQPQC